MASSKLSHMTNLNITHIPITFHVLFLFLQDLYDIIKNITKEDFCTLCNVIIFKKEWIEHINNIHLIKTLCNECNCSTQENRIVFPLYHQLVIHFVKEHIIPIFICPCNFETHELNDALEHFKTCDEEKHTEDGDSSNSEEWANFILFFGH